jgi:hypothetical protein
MGGAFEVRDPDFQLSPRTGMARKHYVDCAKYVLGRAFTHVASVDQPISFPTVPGKTYPQPGAPAWQHRAHEFEALERTFALAGPLLHVEPRATANGIPLRDYYSRHFYNAFTPGHENSLPWPEDLPDATYQFTCEFGGLFKTLLLFDDVLWPWLDDRQKQEMVPTISKWAHHRTTQNNWRLFNILALSFLKKHGYEIDDDLLKSHLLWVASYHAGGGWYLEQTYNYYTISLFVVYGTIWNRAFGDEHHPEIAAVIEQSARELMKTYASFFARDGRINMWARSICYRTWISGGFPVSFMLRGGNPLDPGWARRLCSGSILHFVGREDFYENDIPSLGFYGHREFVLQAYSCPASPFLMFLPFICLALPDDSPFWTATEHDGGWTTLGRRSARVVLDNPGLVVVNHGATGTSEIVPGKTYYEDPNYSKLAYNTHFPWEDCEPGGGTAMEYAFHSLDPRDVRGDDSNFYLTGMSLDGSAGRAPVFRTSRCMFYDGVRDGVLYRQAVMRTPPNNGVGYIIDLAEIVIPGGVIRVDRCRVAFEHELTLGHYGLPHVNGQPAIVEYPAGPGGRVATASIPGRRLALIAYTGWDTVATLVHSGRNAEADESTVLYAYRRRTTKNPPMELMITVLLHRTDDDGWTEDELAPIRSIRVTDVSSSNSVLSAAITLAGGEEYLVDFGNIDGRRAC